MVKNNEEEINTIIEDCQIRAARVTKRSARWMALDFELSGHPALGSLPDGRGSDLIEVL